MTVSLKVEQDLKALGVSPKSEGRRLNKPEPRRDEDAVRLSSSGTKELNRSEVEEFIKPKAITGDRADLSNVKNTLGFLQNAAENVEDLVRQQEILAKRASLLPEHTDLAVTLEDERRELRSEVTRILGTANESGISLSSGASLSYDDNETNTHKVINVATFDLLHVNPREDLLTASEASSAYTILSQARAGDNILTNHINDALNQGKRIRQVEAKDVSKLENESADVSSADHEIKSLAKTIAYKVGSAANDEVQKKRVIDAASKGLDPARVKSLLS